MTKISIPSARLELVLQTPDELLAFIETMSPADRAEVSPDWLARVRETPEGDPWALGFTVLRRDDRTVVGSCGFKGPPDSDGVVEVAYGIESAYRCQGFATESTAALTQFAFDSGRVLTVRAHTKSDNAASARVLAKCGFEYVGDVVDPEDGLVCRWEVEQNSFTQSHEHSANKAIE
ncbi:MAG: GNAT family N-acetyltransferase [Pirellulaceae bacterium]